MESDGRERGIYALSTKIEGLNVFVAEDSNSNYLLINTTLEKSALIHVFSGMEAVGKAQAQLFSVALMDTKYL